MKTTHTPAPWRYENGEIWSDLAGKIGGADRSNPTTHPSERDRNAQLMAAAPELLEALKAILAYEDDTPEPESYGSTVYAIANAAIAKATGTED